MLLADNLQDVRQLLVVDGEVYFSEYYGQGVNTFVKSVPTAGGAVTTRATIPAAHVSRGPVNTLYADQTHLYGFSSGYVNASIWKVPLAGGSPTYLRTGIGGGSLHGIDDNYIYFDTSFAGNGGIRRMPKNGGVDVAHSTQGTWARRSSYDDNYIFWQDHNTKNFYRTEFASGGTILVGSNPGNEHGIYTDSQNLFWVNSGNAGKVEISDLDGGNRYDLVSNAALTDDLVSDGTYVYYYDNSNQAISRIPKVGGAVENLASIALADLRWMTVSDNVLYYVDRSLGGSQSQIYSVDLNRIPEPSTFLMLLLSMLFGSSCLRVPHN